MDPFSLPPVAFLIDIAKDLAKDLVKSAGRAAPEAPALQRVYTDAFAAMLNATARDLTRDELILTRDIFSAFVNNRAVSTLLLDAALSGRAPDVGNLRAHFVAHFDPDTLLVDLNTALAAFAAAIPPALITEASQDSSPLYHRASLRPLLETRAASERIETKLDAAISSRATSIPFQAPPLPSSFIPRPELDVLRDRLLATQAPAGALVVSAIHAQGGNGKTVLATALAHDEAARNRFPDGILWVILGQQPDLLPLLTSWIQALGDYQFKPLNVASATTHLRTLLHDKAVLLVIDDVWESDHAKCFLVGGDHARALVTTRRRHIGEAVDADLFALGVMTPDQSLALLSSRLGRFLEGAEAESAAHLARDVGYLPLALNLVARRIQCGVTWEHLHASLSAEIADLKQLAPARERQRHEEPELEAALNLSLRALRADNEAAWRAFAWLGVLPEDASIAAPMAATLWDTTVDEANLILELLFDESLLLPGVPTTIAGQTYPTYRIHDLFHDLARARLISGDVSDCGSPITELPQAHAALLSRYQTLTRDDLWSSLADDGYIHARLTWHMDKAERPELIHALLCQETPAGRNAWFDALESQGKLAAYVGDVVRAASLADT